MELVRGLYASRIRKSKACAYCHHHDCYMTKSQRDKKRCKARKCSRYEEYKEHQVNKEDERKKQLKKENRQLNQIMY